jgi:hypothetical protein
LVATLVCSYFAISETNICPETLRMLLQNPKSPAIAIYNWEFRWVHGGKRNIPY